MIHAWIGRTGAGRRIATGPTAAASCVVILAILLGLAACTPATSPSASPVGSAAAATMLAPPSASLGPAVLGRDWGKASIVDAGGGDATQTTPPYVNPGSLGHPQAYQGGQADLLDVANGPLGLLSVGYLARDFTADAWASADGLTWVRAAGFPSRESSMAAAVAEGPSMALAVGSSGVDAAAWTSPDGVTWTAIDDPSFHASPQIRMSAVLPVADGFLVGGHVGGLIGPNRAAFWRVEADGTWRRVADGPVFDDSSVTGLAALPDGTLVAVGIAGDAKTSTGAVVWISSDGETWVRTGDAAVLDGAIMRAVTAGPSGLVAVGSDVAASRAVVWTSPDGRGWSQALDAPVFDNFGLKIEMRDVSWTPAGFVAVGHYLFGTQYPAGAVWTSPDGTTWSRVPDVAAFSQGRIDGVAAGGPGVVAVGNYGSPDFSIPTVWVTPGH